MLTPMRSFTLAQGFWLSSFATTSAAQPSVTLLRRTSGVLPINSVTSLAIFIITSSGIGREQARLSQARLVSYWSIVWDTTRDTDRGGQVAAVADSASLPLP